MSSKIKNISKINDNYILILVGLEKFNIVFEALERKNKPEYFRCNSYGFWVCLTSYMGVPFSRTCGIGRALGSRFPAPNLPGAGRAPIPIAIGTSIPNAACRSLNALYLLWSKFT